MQVGTSQIDITPEIGVELQGFALRTQPSNAVTDRLFVRTLVLQNGEKTLLWMVFDLLGMTVALADRIRTRIANELAIERDCIFVSTTHTHSGPGTSSLIGCGAYHSGYVEGLFEKIVSAARLATASSEECTLQFGEGTCALGIDRHRGIDLHTDPRIPVLTWKKCDGSEEIKAVLVSYSMHPVCYFNQGISADWPGEVSRIVGESLPGNPVTLVFSGACGNINPPKVGVTRDQLSEYSRSIADAVLTRFQNDERLIPETNDIRNESVIVALPKKAWSEEGVTRLKEAALAQGGAYREFGEIFLKTIKIWEHNMRERIRAGEPDALQAELGVIRLGNITFVTVNAEIFSHFAREISENANTYVIGCTNGVIGYVAPESVHDSGGYEVDWAPFFYNAPVLKKGGFEMLVKACRSRLQSLHGK